QGDQVVDLDAVGAQVADGIGGAVLAVAVGVVGGVGGEDGGPVVVTEPVPLVAGPVLRLDGELGEQLGRRALRAGGGAAVDVAGDRRQGDGEQRQQDDRGAEAAAHHDRHPRSTVNRAAGAGSALGTNRTTR